MNLPTSTFRRSLRVWAPMCILCIFCTPCLAQWPKRPVDVKLFFDKNEGTFVQDETMKFTVRITNTSEEQIGIFSPVCRGEDVTLRLELYDADGKQLEMSRVFARWQVEEIPLDPGASYDFREDANFLWRKLTEGTYTVKARYLDKPVPDVTIKVEKTDLEALRRVKTTVVTEQTADETFGLDVQHSADRGDKLVLTCWHEEEKPGRHMYRYEVGDFDKDWPPEMEIGMCGDVHILLKRKNGAWVYNTMIEDTRRVTETPVEPGENQVPHLKRDDQGKVTVELARVEPPPKRPEETPPEKGAPIQKTASANPQEEPAQHKERASEAGKGPGVPVVLLSVAALIAAIGIFVVLKMLRR